MLPRVQSYVLATADDDGVSVNATPGAAGNLTIGGALAAGGVATFDVARRVLLTTAADESGKTVTIYGTDRDGKTISETKTGPNATTAYTDLDFKTVTRVAVSAAFTGNIKVGTVARGSTRWFMLNYNAAAFEVGVTVKVTGSVTYTLETTANDLMGYYDTGKGAGPWVDAATPLPIPDQFLGNMSASGQTILTVPCRAVRATIVAGTGTIEVTVIQSGIRG
jgi:hypothetical protein